MTPDPMLGVTLHWLGGLASGSFYVFYRKVCRWSWETYWLVGGFFAWLIMPWTGALVLTHDLLGVLQRAELSTLFLAWLFGALWVFGGLTAGLSIRYLGMSLGQGVTLGFCAAFGTLVPPIFKARLASIASSSSGKVVLIGIAVCLLGIGVAALAGLCKEREMTAEKKKASVQEFNFGRGMGLAVFAGIMSAFFAFGLDAASPLAELSAAAGTATMWTGLPKIVVVLLGGFTTNLVACVSLNIRNRSVGEYLGHEKPTPENSPSKLRSVGWLLANYVFCAAAGITWYLQFFFYTMGETQMGKFQFSSWTLHMASIIIFSTLWGWILREWVGTSRRTHWLVAAGMILLIASTLVVGYGNYLGVVRE